MTSINTNIAATTALRTLQSTNMQLDQTQSRISTGLKIGEAKDNAAYWSISTSLKSDNKAMGTVKDALGLGAATVDTAYQGLNNAKDVLDELKSKLTASTQGGLPRNVIQNEIAELQKQLQSIANSSTFSGENWLAVNSENASYSTSKEVVASFTRDANNAVSIGKVSIDISDVALFDSSSVRGKDGILDGALSLKGTNGRDLDLGPVNTDGNTLKGGLVATTATQGLGAAAEAGTAVAASTLGADASSGTKSTAVYGGAGLTVEGTYADNDTIEIDFGGGITGTITLTGAATTAANSGTVSWATVAGATLSGGTPSFTLTTNASDELVIENNAVGTTAAPTIGTMTVTTADGADSPSATAPAPTQTAGTAAVTAAKAEVSSGNLTIGEFAEGDKVSITLNVNGTSQTFTTDALVAATPGALALSDIATALDGKLTGVADVAVNGTALEFTASADGAKTAFSLEKLTAINEAGSGKTITNGIGSEATAAVFETGSFAALTLDKDDNIYFQIKLDDATAAKDIVINQALVNKALSTASAPVTDGKVTTAADWKKVVDQALSDAGVTGISTAVTDTDKLTFTSASLGASSKIVISDVAASAGADKVSVMEMDISDAGMAKMGALTGAQQDQLLAAYISAVSSTIEKVTQAASNLGAVASRIELQQTFVTNLMDTIDKGVSGLVDADMNEESTRLQALQVKQQLGVQALSIANQSAQNVLSLFR